MRLYVRKRLTYMQIAVASIVGILSGVYIWKPVIQSIQNRGQKDTTQTLDQGQDSTSDSTAVSK